MRICHFCRILELEDSICVPLLHNARMISMSDFEKPMRFLAKLSSLKTNATAPHAHADTHCTHFPYDSI